MADQQAKSAQRTELIRQQKQKERIKLTRQQEHEQAEQARQLKQETVARDEKKLVKKQSSKSKSRKDSKIAARSHDEIYNVQKIVVLQHQQDVDDVKCTGLPASYESCDEAFFLTSY